MSPGHLVPEGPTLYSKSSSLCDMDRSYMDLTQFTCLLILASLVPACCLLPAAGPVSCSPDP